MPVINFLTQTAITKSTDQNSANLINLYLVEDQDHGKYDKAAYPTPGMTLFSSGSALIRALFTEHNITYGIDGNQFFSVSSNGTRTNIGTLNTSTGWAKIKGIADQLLIADSTHGYYYKITANTFGAITDVNFPSAITDIECQDEFGIVLLSNSQKWQASAISDLTTWPALSFASTTGNQNFNQAIVSSHRELFIFGTQTSEVWYNAGTTNFTFGRNTSVFIEYGVTATASVAKGANILFVLGQNPSGGSVVLQYNGYTPTKISTRAIDYQISTYTTINDAIGFCYQQEGHEFYVITFPTANVTWVYDITTQQWHQRQSLVNGSQVKWSPNCFTFNYNKCLIGDSNSGNMYYLDMLNNTEHGNAITRSLITAPIYTSGTWIYLDKIQIDFDNAPGINLSNWNLYISRDGGRTFGSAKAANPQQDAYGMWRVYWNRLGSSRTFGLKITTNADMKPIILGAIAIIRPGAEI